VPVRRSAGLIWRKSQGVLRDLCTCLAHRLVAYGLQTGPIVHHNFYGDL